MRAIRVHEYGEPEVMGIEDVPVPVPGPGQVLVRVHAVGVNPVDAYVRAGQYGRGALPYTPGGDAAGTIEDIGGDVTSFTIGDRVYTAETVTGAYAEMALCEAERVYPLPRHITYQQGAALGVPYGTAYRALFQRARAAPGESVLVHGATGGVGIATVQFARAAGMTVIGSAGSTLGRRLVLEQGAHHVVDHHDPGHLEQVMSLTGGRGVDVIVEFLAGSNLGHDLKVLASRGRVAVVGSRGVVQVDPRETMGREADIRGVMLMRATQTERTAIYAAIGAGLENGTLRPVIHGEYPLSHAPQVHRLLFDEHALGKRVLVP